MAGHVFIVHADLRRLACHAWAMPCDKRARAPRYLLPGQPVPRWPRPVPVAFLEETRRALRLDDWPADRPRPWLVDVGGVPGVPREWYVHGARHFLDAVDVLPTSPAWLRRHKPLVALPILGSGRGCGNAGEIVTALLPELYEAAGRRDFDVALVAFDGPAHAAAQAARRQLSDPRAWPELEPALRERADDLARRAARGELALFLGAGVSVSAGLPSWRGMLARLASAANLTPTEQTALSALDLMDQAALLEARLGGTARLQQEIRSLFTWDHYALSHALLAALPVREVVTTNYDQLFERACEPLGVELSVLRYAVRPGAGRWLLKMHGCVSRPEEIVVTRGDYLAYALQREALAGIVQALLVTRHMLFVGFSLNDDNFHRIAGAVRRALRAPGDAASVFGTALSLTHNPLLAELWRNDLDCVGMLEPAEGPSDGEPSPRDLEAARRLEIFLDYLGAGTLTAGHLLDPRYDQVLTEAERVLREELLMFLQRVPPSSHDTAAWAALRRLLASLGLRE
jgi:hypothetical protein